MCQTDSDTATGDAADGCCDADGERAAPARGGHWIEPLTLETELPADLRTALGRFVGVGSVETLAGWSEQVRQRTGSGPVGVEELCHTDKETAHWGAIDGTRHHFQCFYDAVVLAALEDRPVDVHTVSPDGAVVRARAVGDERLTATPETAVFSFGIALDAHERSGDPPTLQDSYAAICPYVKAFPDREAYETWAQDVPAATVATSLSGTTAFARALAGETA